MSKRTITLTDRPPVVIEEDNWPMIASASYHDYDGQYEFQSFRHWRGFLGVRQHADGRAIVYATCSAEGCGSSSTHEYRLKGGELLAAPTTTTTTKKIIAAIHEVHRGIAGREDMIHESWANLADECIADLPAEEI